MKSDENGESRWMAFDWANPPLREYQLDGNLSDELIEYGPVLIGFPFQASCTQHALPLRNGFGSSNMAEGICDAAAASPPPTTSLWCLPIPKNRQYDPAQPFGFGLPLNILFAFASTFTVSDCLEIELRRDQDPTFGLPGGKPILQPTNLSRLVEYF